MFELSGGHRGAILWLWGRTVLGRLGSETGKSSSRGLCTGKVDMSLRRSPVGIDTQRGQPRRCERACVDCGLVHGDVLTSALHLRVLQQVVSQPLSQPVVSCPLTLHTKLRRALVLDQLTIKSRSANHPQLRSGYTAVRFRRHLPRRHLVPGPEVRMPRMRMEPIGHSARRLLGHPVRPRGSHQSGRVR
jgi:hypothetical protein